MEIRYIALTGIRGAARPDNGHLVRDGAGGGKVQSRGKARVPGMARSVSGGAPPPSRALRASSGNDLRPPLTAEPLHPLRSETKGQAGACPDRTQAIPCKVQQSSSEDRCRARCVPDRTVERGNSRSLTETRPQRLTCIDANQRPQTRSLPSWSYATGLEVLAERSSARTPAPGAEGLPRRNRPLTWPPRPPVPPGRRRSARARER